MSELSQGKHMERHFLMVNQDRSQRSPLFCTHMILWCHLYATLLIAIPYNPNLCCGNSYMKTKTNKKNDTKNLYLNQGLIFTKPFESRPNSGSHQASLMEKPSVDRLSCQRGLNKAKAKTKKWWSNTANLHMLIVCNSSLFCFVMVW